MSKEKFNISITSYHEEVTGSCHRVKITFCDGYEINLLVDCGITFDASNLFETDKEVNINDITFDATEIDAVLITHSHADHVGLLPLLYKKGFRGYVYISEADWCINEKTKNGKRKYEDLYTGSLLAVSLRETAEILQKEKKRLYDSKDLDNLLHKVRPLKYNVPTDLSYYNKDKNKIRRLKVRMLPNGHLPGAAVIEITISYNNAKRRVIFSGDYKNSNYYLNSTDDFTTRSNVPTDVIIESTYATTLVPHEAQLCDYILKAIKKKKTVVLSTFTNFRIQQVLHLLRLMQDYGELDISIPIFVDTLQGKVYINKYDGSNWLNEEFRDFIPKNMTYVDIETRSELLFKTNNAGNESNLREKCKIIICSGANGSVGTSPMYIKSFIGWRGASFAFLSKYTFGNSAIKVIHDKAEELKGLRECGLEITEEQKKITVNGVELSLRADVLFTGEFSLHAIQPELVKLLNSTSGLQNVFINHGNNDVKYEFAKVVEEKVKHTGGVYVEHRNTCFTINDKGKVVKEDS